MQRQGKRRQTGGNQWKWGVGGMALLIVMSVLLVWLRPQIISLLHDARREGDGFHPDSLVHGIDVSRHQGKIHWQKVVQENPDLKFVFVKATEGKTLKDPFFAKNFYGAQKQGLSVGAYHYMTTANVRQQFENYKQTVPKEALDLLPMVDIEEGGVARWTSRQIADSLMLFCNLLKAHYGKYPIIYTYTNFYNRHRLYEDFHKFYLFIASYNTHPMIEGKGRANIWQMSEKGVLPGIDAYVDLDVLSQHTTIKDISL